MEDSLWESKIERKSKRQKVSLTVNAVISKRTVSMTVNNIYAPIGAVVSISTSDDSPWLLLIKREANDDENSRCSDWAWSPFLDQRPSKKGPVPLGAKCDDWANVIAWKICHWLIASKRKRRGDNATKPRSLCKLPLMLPRSERRKRNCYQRDMWRGNWLDNN